MHKSNYYCRAGFIHFAGEDCEHVSMNLSVDPYPKKTTGINLNDDFYRDEELAKRRAANKLKYAPGNQNRSRFNINPIVNQAR